MALVKSLQKDALNENIDISSLLRKAYVVAFKLNIDKFIKWIEFEQNGYDAEKDLPIYRYAFGEVCVNNPYRGLVPIILSNLEGSEKLREKCIFQSIEEIKELIVNTNPENPSLLIRYPSKLEQLLMRGMSIRLIPYLVIDKSQLQKIISAVRNVILKWALNLEKDGIIGDDIEFTENEKEAAAKIVYNINNYIGTMTNSQLQQNTKNSKQKLKKN
ncbi:MAG TPA: hypothetical protein PKY81_16580 [bacterium]|nr:hypothetical protein [bacterium]